MVKLCVFDLDGTLVNSLNDLADAANYALKKNGFSTYHVEKYRYFVGDGVPMLIKRILGDNDSPELESILLSDFNKYYNGHYANHTAPYEGIKELLSELSKRSILCAVLSNKPDNFVKIIVGEIFSDFRFAQIQGKMDEFPKKPNPAALKSIMKKLNVNTDETLYIGDSNVDIFTGKNAGVKTCGVLWGFRTKEELEEAGADYIATSPLDVLDLIN